MLGEMERIEVAGWEQIYGEFLIVPTLPGIWTCRMNLTAVLSHRARDNPFHNGINVLEFGDIKQIITNPDTVQ